MGLLEGVVSEKGIDILGEECDEEGVCLILKLLPPSLPPTAPLLHPRAHAYTLYSSLEPCGTPTPSFHMTSSLLVYRRNTPL